MEEISRITTEKEGLKKYTRTFGGHNKETIISIPHLQSYGQGYTDNAKA